MSDPDLTPTQIERLKTALQALKQSLTAHISQSQADTAPVTLDQQSVGRVSRIDAIQQQQMAIASHGQASYQLQQVELALGKLANEEYGYCEECAETILFARLEAQPTARLCLNCQSAAEND
ncbi:MAG: TraR/DksA C4-type zinc finger protein [Pseudomonadota bacterium]